MVSSLNIVQFSINKPDEKAIITVFVLIEENEWQIWQFSAESVSVVHEILYAGTVFRL
jgi:hypothetical protein